MQELLPPKRKPHPTAKAFFDALDLHQHQHQHQQKEEDDDDSDDDDGKDRKKKTPSASASASTTKTKTGTMMSRSLQRKCQSLGWRNRYSQNEYYPINEQHQCNSKNNKTTIVNFSVKQVQRGEVDGTYGTGATVWPAAVVLIKYLEYTTAHANANANAINTSSSSSQNNQVNVVNKHIIDLGAGTGVTSIAAAILGAKSIVCTDGIDSVVQLAKDNIQRVVAGAGAPTANDAEKRSIVTSTTTPIPVINNCPIRTQKYWWGEEGTAKTIITIADCVLPKLYPIEPLVQAIDECLMIYDDETNTDNNSNNNNNSSSNACAASSCAILSYEYRYYTTDYDPKNEFIKLATAKGLALYTVPKGDQDPIYSTDDIEIWIVTRNKTKNEKDKSKRQRQRNESNAE
ncbi:hypothetical protein FRACYDRAFT_193223 [Fragilariopsis cylindrus CCMP1102]|uniref:S-adenosyl-L-methionine-dependent methyltransferase n=1 Tax=Fragilariopsis cylindrus CCMP1102 TaxID=635003 RepID=A0A1E7EYQ5_9STRA|nr:hypothetical protein FRACYDRAFT_193223 [Fragilariopsis cylindrus CCMP1102]|eukprot:OEU11150.1 hypothetical protein FRACYDRAFT_193223 [Fragilariopsis cylindrus CCMP1102]